MAHRAERLLHVENDPLVARAVRRVLLRAGFELVSVPGRAEALSWALDRSLAMTPGATLGLFDVDLDDGCGVDLAEQLLRLGAVQHAWFYTATRDASKLARAARLGTVFTKNQNFERVVVEHLELTPDPHPAPPLQGSLLGTDDRHSSHP